MKYLDEVPRELPKDGRVIVHNRTHPQWADQYPGHSGFRVWTAGKSRVKRTPKGKGPLQPCDCGWSGLPHYRIDAEEGEPWHYGKPPSVKGKLMPAEVREQMEAVLEDIRSMGGKEALKRHDQRLRRKKFAQQHR